MSKETQSGRGMARIFNYAQNTLTVIGSVLTTISGIVIVVMFIVEAAGALKSTYAGLLAFVVLPAIFVFGLVLIPAGMALRKRRLSRASQKGEAAPLAFPRLDFNEAYVRRVALAVASLTVVNAVILGTATYLGVEHMESVEFCGEACHTVMQPEFAAYQQSPHSRVACVQCHIGPGASWFVRSKLDGLRQVWHTVAGSYHRPIQSPIEELRPARETCEQCHWPAKHHGDKVRVFARFGSDENNTASYTGMMIKTGGGSLDLGRHGGIHWWHIYSDNHIRYMATDDTRQEIAWVELTTADGEVRTYTRDGVDLPTAADVHAKARTMDCIDCHNRPTHLFQPPTKALDALLEDRPGFAEIPYFKKTALELIEKGYDSHAQGVEAVNSGVLSFYRSGHQQIWESRREEVELAAQAAASIYAKNSFPEMGVTWETHANNIGHDDFPGCWRCHDDELSTRDGEHVIPMDCETCHTFLFEDLSTLPDLAELIIAGANVDEDE